jgi:hypothetical protein
VGDTGTDAIWFDQFEAVHSGASDSLLIDHRAVSEHEIQQLPQLANNLRQLMIDAGGVSDSSLEVIGRLPKLMHLRVRESAVSDAGIGLLVKGGARELKIVNLPQATITAEGIRQLAQLPALMQIRLGGAQLDDAAAKEFIAMPALRSLHLIGPSMTAQALDCFASIPGLASLYLDDCPMPDEAWQKLFLAKPNLHVHIDQHHHDRDPSAHPHEPL